MVMLRSHTVQPITITVASSPKTASSIYEVYQTQHGANIAAALACETLAARPKIFVAIQLEEHQASDGS
jgi:hypothetical protein